MPLPATAASDSSDTLPGEATRYQALLEEYNRLLEKLQEQPASISALNASYIKPQPFSPLDLHIKKRSALQTPGEVLRPDGHVSLARMALFYGLTPWNCANPTEHQATLHALEEKRARHALQLDTGVDIDSLACQPNDTELELLNAKRRGPSKEPLDVLLARLTTTKIHEVIGQFLPPAETSLIRYLVKNLSPDITTTQVDQTPNAYLEKIFQSADATRLAQMLLEKLGWYGAKNAEPSSPLVRNKLLSRAVRSWGRRDGDSEQDIAGYPWRRRSNYGKSYQSIWSEFQAHLLQTERASSSTEAILLACLYRCEFPLDFQRDDVPPDVHYRSSVVWVNFVHGLNLVEAFEPERLPRMTFQQLVDFPLEETLTATEEELELIAWCRIPPAVDWAIANGLVLEDKYNIYSEATQQRALEELDKHNEDLKAALIQLDEPSPERKEIANREIDKAFGPNVFTTSAYKLVRDHGPDYDRGVRSLKERSYSFRDVYMWKGHKNLRWRLVRHNGDYMSTTLAIKSDGSIDTAADWIRERVKNRKLPDVNTLFESEYKAWLATTKAAYRTLLTSLFSRLPHDDRQAIEYGETKIYTLRQSTTGLELDQETTALTLHLRLRFGFILKLNHKNQSSWYECLPRAGVIHKRTDLTMSLLNGREETEEWRGLRGTHKVKVLRGQDVPFDWDAYEKGQPPKGDTTCKAIIEQLGDAFRPETPIGDPPYISSNRASAVATFIANTFFYQDEDKLHASAQGQTELEKTEQRRHTLLEKIGKFVPFYGNLDDLNSENPNKNISAAFGIFIDSVSFAMPLGKFVSGSAKLVSPALNLGFRQALPRFNTLSRKLLTATLQNLNPLGGLPTLAKGLVHGLYVMNRFALKAAARQIDRLAGRSGQYDFLKGLPQVKDPGRFRPLADSDDLISTRGVNDIPARQVASAQLPDYRMIEPITNKAYGPPMLNKLYRSSVGRSFYRSVDTTDQHLHIKIADNTKVREVPEVDGRTAIYMNDVPYRADGDVVRRIEMIDDGSRLKRNPCRVKRSPGDMVCINEFVDRGPHLETPALGSFDEEKGYAAWFGERICVPKAQAGQSGEFFVRDGQLYRVLGGAAKPWKGSMTQLGFPTRTPIPKQQILANLQFRKGIYTRIEIQGTYEGCNELHRVGAILVPGIDEKTIHLFARPNSNKGYHATIAVGEQLTPHQTYFMKQLKPLEQADGTLGSELIRVFEGSMTANNMVAIHGKEAVERAMKTMERIAIPLGTTANPPANMKWLKVDTSPGEALMFDNATRMIVTRLPEGSTTWSRSREASDTLKQRTAEIFDTLFERTVIDQSVNSVFRINTTMQKLNTSLDRSLRRANPRNIAYAEVKKTDGAREVYVSVSGGQKVTKKLPLFRNNSGTDRVRRGDTTYINVDWRVSRPTTSLLLDDQDNLLAIPRTPLTLPGMPTSLDSESKLISTINRIYPDRQSIVSVNIATTMRPCESCAVIMKAFGHDGTQDLNVLWS